MSTWQREEALAGSDTRPRLSQICPRPSPLRVPSLLLSCSPEPTHDLAKASLHLHVGLTVFVDVSFAVLTAKPKFVVDLGEGENI